MTRKGILYGLGIIVGLFIFGWVRLGKTDGIRDAQTVSQTLPAGDKAKVVIDAKRHTVTTVTRSAKGVLGNTVQFLAPNASIETKPDGTVVVTSRSWGTELSPWTGLSVDTETHARGSLGLNLVYWQRWELGAGVSCQLAAFNPRMFIGGSYNVYSNILLTAAIDNHKAVSVGVALRF